MHDDNPTRLVHAHVVGPIEKQWCRVRFDTSEADAAVEEWARTALPGSHRLGIGDEVLTAVSDGAALRSFRAQATLSGSEVADADAKQGVSYRVAETSFPDLHTASG